MVVWPYDVFAIVKVCKMPTMLEQVSELLGKRIPTVVAVYEFCVTNEEALEQRRKLGLQ